MKDVPAGQSRIDDFFRIVPEIIYDDLFFIFGGNNEKIASASFSLSIEEVDLLQGNDSVLEENEGNLFDVPVKNTVPALHGVGMVPGV